MPGPAKKASHLKSVSGTTRPDREPPVAAVELPTISEVPDPPDWLPNAHAMKEWKRLAPVLVNNRLLTDAGLMAFGHLCSLHGKLVQLWAAGESPTGHLLSQYRALINDFGLTPVAQGKVKPSGEQAKENPFKKNGRKPA
jgi:phage terminase small subunit